MDQSNRSVLRTTTNEFKKRFREYLEALAQDDDAYRVELISKLEWCFDRWEYWRQKFYPDADLMFPFFQTHRKGTEFGHYATVGSSGQPSVISLKLSMLLDTSDVTIWKNGRTEINAKKKDGTQGKQRSAVPTTERLILKQGAPNRDRFIDLVILHELVHQYLHEASPNAADYERSESGRDRFKGHGPLFAAECNRINEVLHPEMGLDFVRVRHSKKSHAKVRDVQRISCAQFGIHDLFFAWDFSDEDLTNGQREDNLKRLQQGLEYFDGAVELVREAPPIALTFVAPFQPDCADVCIQQLLAHDQENGTNLLDHFLEAVLDHAGASSAAPVNIPPAEGQYTVTSVRDITPPREPQFVQVTRVDPQPESGPTVPATGDGCSSLTEEYPIRHPECSLLLLASHIEESGLTKSEFAQQRFGHKNGQQLSRHLKRLKDAVEQRAAA